MAHQKDKGLRVDRLMQEEDKKEEKTDEGPEELTPQNETPVADETPETTEAAEETKEASLEEGEQKEVPAEEKKKAKPAARKEKKEEKEIVEERIYTVPLGRALIQPPRKRAPRAMHILEGFITKHMKLESRREEESPEEEETIGRLVISNEVNEKIWERGIEKPPRKIRVKAEKDEDGNVTVYLAEGD